MPHEWSNNAKAVLRAGEDAADVAGLAGLRRPKVRRHGRKSRRAKRKTPT
jgi:hypothetical protein